MSQAAFESSLSGEAHNMPFSSEVVRQRLTSMSQDTLPHSVEKVHSVLLKFVTVAFCLVMSNAHAENS